MAKEDIDDKVKDAEIPGGDETQEQEAPKDIRGALKAAFKEQEEKDDARDDTGSDKSGDEQPISKSKRSTKSDNNKSEIREDLPDDASKARSRKKEETDTPEGEISSEESEEKKEVTKLEPVGHWKTKGKAVWDKIDVETQQAILAREQEVSQGFQQVSQRLKSLEEVEKVLAPRIQAIQQNGYQPAQVVDSLFQWMERLGNPNPAVKLRSLKELATNFGINLDQIAPKQTQDQDGLENDNTNYIDPNNPPPWAEQFVQQVQGEVGTLKKTLDAQKQAAADAFVSNWAKDKKYYGQVSQLMGQLLSSGAVPSNADGSLDLDGAYQTALKVHPTVSAQVQQEQEAQAKAAAKAKAEKDAKDRAAKLASARRAGSGIRPSAPSFPVATNPKANGKSKPMSVRDSIKSALDEHTDTA